MDQQDGCAKQGQHNDDAGGELDKHDTDCGCDVTQGAHGERLWLAWRHPGVAPMVDSAPTFHRPSAGLHCA